MRTPALFPAIALSLSAAASAQQGTGQLPITFSITNDSASEFAPDCAGFPIVAADLLAPDSFLSRPVSNAPQPPCILLLHTGAPSVGLLSGWPDSELDAFSRGQDRRLSRKPRRGSVYFSVDARARGIAFPVVFTPTLESEAACGDAAASLFADTGLWLGSSVFGVGPRRAIEVIDGDGLASCSGHSAPSLGLVEPILPPQGLLGDDLDAVDIGLVESPVIFFSLEGTLFDPCGGAGTGTAQINGFPPAAVLASNGSGAPPIVWATPLQLGLDTTGFGKDDLDALAIWDNGNFQYDAVESPFGWNQQQGDMVLFSVRRGSDVIGLPDSRLGLPIEESDVLAPPLPGAVLPAIVIRGEQLGLRTRRSGTAGSCGATQIADDLDALDVLNGPEFDCNGNGVEDALDILRGTSLDVDMNGVPDEC